MRTVPYGGAHDIVPALDGAFSGSDAHAQVLDLEDRTLLGYAWNKVYRAEVLDGIAFETVPLIEDVVFNVAVFNRVENLVLVARPLYRYEKRAAANLTAKFVPEYYEVHRRRIDDVYRQQVSWGLDSADVRSRLGARYARYILVRARAQLRCARGAEPCGPRGLLPQRHGRRTLPRARPGCAPTGQGSPRVRGPSQDAQRPGVVRRRSHHPPS